MAGLFVALAVLGLAVLVAIAPSSGPGPDSVAPSVAEGTVSETSPGASRVRGRNAPATERGTESVVGHVMLHGRSVAGTRVWVDGIEAQPDEQGRFEVADRPRGQHRIVAAGAEPAELRVPPRE